MWQMNGLHVRRAHVGGGTYGLLAPCCSFPLTVHPPLLVSTRYIGLQGKHIGIDSFGASAPAPILYEKFGITTAHVVKAAKEVMAH